MSGRGDDGDVTATDPEGPVEGEGSVRLVGTAHVSEESVERVRETIEEEQPDVVAVELDEQRYRQMQGETPEDMDAATLLRGGVALQFLAYWVLSYVQARLGERFDIEPGADMRAGVEAAQDIGAGVALVDRDIQVTIQRFWSRLGPRRKLGMLGNLTLAIGSPVAVVAGVGLVVGSLFGLLCGAFAAGPLGFAGSDFVAATGSEIVALVGGGLAGALGGVLLWSFAEPLLATAFDALSLPNSLATRIATGVGIGVAVGVALAVGGGFAVGPLSLGTGQLVSLGGFALQLGTGLALGVAVGGVLGALGGVLLAQTLPEEESIEEFDPEDLTDVDVVSAMMEEFRQFSPGGAEALIDERDAYIAHNLINLREQGYRVVAVVGAGHRAGIEEYLEHPDRLPPMKSLTGRDDGGFPWFRAVMVAIGLGFLAFFVLLALAALSPDSPIAGAAVVRVLAAWFLFNGVFAFALAKLAGARWLSAAVGGSVAWLTSLNPLLAPGWFTGYVELRYQRVNISDIGRLNDLLGDETIPVRELYHRLLDVPLFRLIAIVAFTNVGSLIASVAFPFVVLPFLGGPFDSVGELTSAMRAGIAYGFELVTSAL